MTLQNNKKTVALAAIVAVAVVAISAGIVMTSPHLQTVAASSSNKDKVTSVGNPPVSDSAGSSNLGHVGMMRTINNTHCVSTPGGPQIC